MLAEWILRPGQFQGNPGSLGPDRGDGTRKVTLRTERAARTRPHQALDSWALGQALSSWAQDFPKERLIGGMVF